MVRRSRPQKRERAQIKARERQTFIITNYCTGGRAKLLRRGNGSYYWSVGLVDVRSYDTNVSLNSLFIFKSCFDGRLQLEEATWDSDFDNRLIPNILSSHQLEEESLEDQIEKELDEALAILKGIPTWRADLRKVVDQFCQNPNVLLDLEKPVLTPFRRALIGSLRWRNQDGWILVRKRLPCQGSAFKWIEDLPISCQVVNLLLLKRIGLEGFKLQPIPEEFDLDFLLRKFRQEYLYISKEEETEIGINLEHLYSINQPWTDHIDHIENLLNKYEPHALLGEVEAEILDW